MGRERSKNLAGALGVDCVAQRALSTQTTYLISIHLRAMRNGKRGGCRRIETKVEKSP